MIRIAFISVVVMLAWPAPAAADLYRWVDPETGSVKFSSYPPPWYGDPERELRSPKVERIPEMKTAPKAEPSTGQGPELGALEAMRKSLLQQLAVLPGREDFNRAGAGFKQQLETYRALAAEIDRIDPGGAARRRAENQTLFEKLLGGR